MNKLYWFFGVVVFSSIMTFIIWPIIKRWFADNGWFWVRPPQMHSVISMQDRKIKKIFIVCANSEKTQRLVKEMKLSGVNESQILTSIEGNIFWIGLPWYGNEIYSWYEDSRDDDNPDTGPLYRLYLGERIWDYSSPKKGETYEKFIEEWGVDTADPIQVRPKIVVVVEVLNPIKTLFNVSYFQEAIQKEILSAWKKSVQDLEYFSYDDTTEKDVVISEEGDKKIGKKAMSTSKLLQTKAQQNLDKILGLSETVVDPENYAKEKVAYTIYRDYGVWLKRVSIRDIDPTDSAIRSSLEAKLKAQTEAAAATEKAKGTRDSKIITTDGEVYETKEKGKANAYAIEVGYKARARGLNIVAEKLGLTPEDNKIMLVAEMISDLAEKSDYTYISGDPASVGNWALAAVDRMKDGVQKIKTGSGADAKIGFAQIKKIWSELTAEQRAELTKISSL